MKRIIVLTILITVLAGMTASALSEGVKVADGGPRNLVSANLLGPLFGIYRGSYERAVSEDLSVFVRPQYFNYNLGLQRLVFYDEAFSWWSLSTDVGVNYYLEGALDELYVGGGGIAGYTRIAYDDPDFEASAQGFTLGAHAHVGYRLLFDFISIAPQAGIRYEMTLVEASAEFDDPSVPGTVQESAADVEGRLTFPIGIGIAIAF